MTAETLKSYSCKDLAEMARKRGVQGWHSMRKDQLVKALSRSAKSPVRNGVPSAPRIATPRIATPQRKVSGDKSAARRSSTQSQTPPVAKSKQPVIARKLQTARDKVNHLKNLAGRNGKAAKSRAKDRLIVMVRDPYWLHACWELTRQNVERAQAAVLSQEWHQTKPILRLYEVAGSGSSAAERAVRDIDIHGGVNNWYIQLQDPPKSHRLDIGYVTPSGKFFVLARSNAVTTPKPGVMDELDENWTDVASNYDKIYAMSGGYSPDGVSSELQELFEERLRRPMGSPLVTGFGVGVEGVAARKKEFSFEIDAELIVFGTTEPDAHVTLQGDPVKLRPDGSFTVRFSLPNCRQVIPAVASSSNGMEQRTIVLAVERNTKVMEPLTRDAAD